MNAIELVAVCAIIETTLIFYLSDMDKEPKNPCPRGGWPRSGKPLAWLRRGGTSSKVHDGYLLLILKIVLKIKKLKKKKKKGASLAIKIGGGLINGTAFVGGSYHAKYLIGEQNSVNNFPISTSRVFNNNKVK